LGVSGGGVGVGIVGLERCEELLLAAGGGLGALDGVERGDDFGGWMACCHGEE
jgi:hypothetical protein